MIRYVLGRVAQAVLVLWAAYTVTFVVLYLLPSDPVALMLAADNVELDSLSPAQVAAARARFGLDLPVHLQYVHLLVKALHGDLGVIRGNDIVIALSYSGENEELVLRIDNSSYSGFSLRHDACKRCSNRCCDNAGNRRVSRRAEAA